MNALVPLVIGALTVFAAGSFAVQTLVRSGALSAKTRIGVVTAFLDTVLALVLAHVLIPWSNVPTALWLIPVGLAAAGVAGAVLRWTALPFTHPDRSARRQIAFAAVHVAFVRVIIGLVVLL